MDNDNHPTLAEAAQMIGTSQKQLQKMLKQQFLVTENGVQVFENKLLKIGKHDRLSALQILSCTARCKPQSLERIERKLLAYARTQNVSSQEIRNTQAAIDAFHTQWQIFKTGER